MRVFPPLRPPARPDTAFLLSVSETSPVDISTISLASWLMSRGLLGRVAMRPLYRAGP